MEPDINKLTQEWWEMPDDEYGISWAERYENGDIDDHRTWRLLVFDAFRAGFLAAEKEDE